MIPDQKILHQEESVDAASRRIHPIHGDEVGYFDPTAPIAVLDGNLPHWRQEGATYFVTYRLADSLPQEKLRQWQAEREAWLVQHPEPHTPETKKEYWRLFPERIHEWLDAGYGECLLARPEVREIVVAALNHFDGDRYLLLSWVVMPNHVHVLVSPLGDYELSDILHSWKSYTSKAINRRLGRTKSFWQKESFDHIVRSPDSLQRIDDYIFANPASLAPGTFTLSPGLQTRRDAAST